MRAFIFFWRQKERISIYLVTPEARYFILLCCSIWELSTIDWSITISVSFRGMVLCSLRFISVVLPSHTRTASDCFSFYFLCTARPTRSSTFPKIDSNSNGSYYYSNDNGSTYYNSGSGYSRYTSSSGHTTQSYGGSSKK